MIGHRAARSGPEHGRDRLARVERAAATDGEDDVDSRRAVTVDNSVDDLG